MPSLKQKNYKKWFNSWQEKQNPTNRSNLWGKDPFINNSKKKKKRILLHLNVTSIPFISISVSRAKKTKLETPPSSPPPAKARRGSAQILNQLGKSYCLSIFEHILSQNERGLKVLETSWQQWLLWFNVADEAFIRWSPGYRQMLWMRWKWLFSYLRWNLLLLYYRKPFHVFSWSYLIANWSRYRWGWKALFSFSVCWYCLC